MRTYPLLVCSAALAFPLALASASTASAQTIGAPASTSASASTSSSTTAPEVTLDEAIAIALSNHGDVGAARQSSAAAQNRIAVARSARSPQANVTVGSNLARGGVTTSSTSTGTTDGTNTTVSSTSSYTVGTQTNFGLSQTIFDGGRGRAQVRQAQAQAGSAGAGIGVARQNLAFQVASGFYEQLRQERLIRQRDEQVKLAEGQLAQIEAQIQEGTAARVDAQSVRVTLSQARFDLASAQKALATAQTNLRNTLGLARGAALRLRESPDVAALSASFTSPPDAAATAPQVLEAAPEAAPQASEVAPQAPGVAPQVLEDAPEGAPATEIAMQVLEGTPKAEDAEAAPVAPAETAPTIALPALASLDEYLSQAQSQRPDLLQSRASVASSEAALGIAQADRKPQVGVTAGYNLQNLANSGRGLTAGLSLSLPIFDAGSRKASVKAAQSELAASRTRQAQLEKDVAADVEATYVSVSGASERITNARALVESARTNLEAATEKYRAGVGIVLDVVNAQTQFAAAQTSATAALYDYQISLADLSRAVGRFAPDATPQAAPIIAASANR